MLAHQLGQSQQPELRTQVEAVAVVGAVTLVGLLALAVLAELLLGG